MQICKKCKERDGEFCRMSRIYLPMGKLRKNCIYYLEHMMLKQIHPNDPMYHI